MTTKNAWACCQLGPFHPSHQSFSCHKRKKKKLDYTSWKLRIFSDYFKQFNYHIPDANENKGVAETAPLIL